MTAFGFNPLNQYFSDVKQIGYYGIFAQKLSAYEARFQLHPHPDFARPMDHVSFRDLRQIIKTAHEHGATLIIFIPPYHAQFLDIMRRAGLWSSFKNWKLALVRVIAS